MFNDSDSDYENMPHTYASMTKRSEEVGLSLTSSDSANLDRNAGDCHQNAATTPLPVVSLSPFLHRNMNETTQYYAGKELADSGFSFPYQHTRTSTVHPSGTAMDGDIGQSLLNKNLAGAESIPSLEEIYERFRTVGSGSKKESESNTIMPKVNVAGNSERVFHPPINTYHNNQLGSTSFTTADLDMNRAFIGFQEDGGTSYGFQRPPVSDQNHYYLKQVDRDLGNGGVEDISMEFADRSMVVVPSIPILDSQTMPCESTKRQVVNGIGMTNEQPPIEILPKNNGNFSSQFTPRPPLLAATRSTEGNHPPSHNGQSQVVGGSIQQSSSIPRQHSASDQAIQTGKANITAQVSRPPITSSLKRAASQPLPYTVQDQRRKTLPTQPFFIHQSVPTWSRLGPSVPNTPQSVPPLIHTAQSSVSPSLPYTWTPLIPPTPPLPPCIDKRTSSHPPPLLSNQQQLIAQSLARQGPLPNQQLVAPHQRTPLIAPLPNRQLVAQSRARQRTLLKPPPATTTGSYIKYKDQTPEPVGYKCLLCKMDLSFVPEGPISQPPVPPTAAVLSCGHTFHAYCLERVAPDDQSKDPPCIPCALSE